ncbi:carboxypeptidase-like regulatory domain-containing protein [Archangium lipolyticum]|uniref:carboxypeptidase-like regulatory domain-containing protein n=1 Tax=Archangium lipolyticum TaxID=2970465 RepID=UPI002149D57A|nr:carboxypeptidase-like regulatory domain-containing protein [Archangium lipolyticum]
MRPVWLGACLAALVMACSGQGTAVQVTGKVVLEGETDHSGVLVTLAGRSVLTDKEGSWRVELLSGGAYVVQVSASGTLEGTQAVAVEVPDEGSASVPEVKLTPVGEVEGQATLGVATGNAGITVMAPGSSAVAVTDDSGHYVLRGVPTGSRTLEAVAPGHARSSIPVQVRRAARANAAPVVLSRARSVQPLSATLLGASGHAGLVATLLGTELTATTAADGSFSFNGVPDGVYSLSLRGGSYEELVPSVVFLQGTAYLSQGVGLVPMPPLKLVPAKRLASATQVGLPQNWEGMASQPLIQRTMDGGRFLFLSDTAYQLIMDRGSIMGLSFDGTLRTVSSTGDSSFVLGSSVTSFVPTSDGAHVLFTRDDGTLLSGDLATGESRPLAAGLFHPSRYLYGGDPLTQYGASPDGSKVVYLKDNVLFVVGAEGGTSTALGPATSSAYYSGRSEPAVFSADGNRLFYYASGAGLSLADLRTGGSQAITASLSSFRVTPDRSIAVTLASNNLSVSRLTAAGVSTNAVDTSVSEFMMSPDGARVVYRTTTSLARLLTLPSTVPTALSTTNYDLLQFSPDGRQFLLLDRDSTAATYILYNVDLTTPSTGKWSLWSGSSLPSSFQYSTNGAWVVFSVGSSYYAVGAKGTGLRSLLTTSGAVYKTAIAPTNDRIFLLADVTAASRSLQSVPFGTGPAVNLASGVSDFGVSWDGSRVVYLNGQGSLRAVAPVGGTDTLLSEGVRSFSLSPDSAWVLYTDVREVARAMNLGTGEVRVLSDRASRVFWSSPGQVALVRADSPAPLAFQDGLYLINVP